MLVWSSPQKLLQNSKFQQFQQSQDLESKPTGKKQTLQTVKTLRSEHQAHNTSLHVEENLFTTYLSREKLVTTEYTLCIWDHWRYADSATPDFLAAKHIQKSRKSSTMAKRRFDWGSGCNLTPVISWPQQELPGSHHSTLHLKWSGHDSSFDL